MYYWMYRSYAYMWLYPSVHISHASVQMGQVRVWTLHCHPSSNKPIPRDRNHLLNAGPPPQFVARHSAIIKPACCSPGAAGTATGNGRVGRGSGTNWSTESVGPWIIIGWWRLSQDLPFPGPSPAPLCLHTFPLANTTHWTDAGWMLYQRRRRWSNVNPASLQWVVPAQQCAPASERHWSNVYVTLGHRLRRRPTSV